MTNNSDIARRRKKATEYQRQGSQMHREEWMKREYNRHNYKRWPWGSFLVVALVSGVIFFVCGSPLTINHMHGVLLVVSIIFITLGSILLLPSLAAIIFLVGLYIYRHAGMDCPCQSIVDRFSDRPMEPDTTNRLPEPTGIKIWTSTVPEVPNGDIGRGPVQVKAHLKHPDGTAVYSKDNPSHYDDVIRAHPGEHIQPAGVHRTGHHSNSEYYGETSSYYTDESDYDMLPSHPMPLQRHTYDPSHTFQAGNARSKRREFSSDSQYGSFEREDSELNSHLYKRHSARSPRPRRLLPSLRVVRQANRRCISCPHVHMSDLSDDCSIDRSQSSSEISSHGSQRRLSGRGGRSRTALWTGDIARGDMDVAVRARSSRQASNVTAVELRTPRSGHSRSGTRSERSVVISDSSYSNHNERNQNVLYIDEMPRVHRKVCERPHGDRVHSKQRQHAGTYNSEDTLKNSRVRSRTRSPSPVKRSHPSVRLQQQHHRDVPYRRHAHSEYDLMTDTDTSTAGSPQSLYNNGTARTGFYNPGFESDEGSHYSHSKC